MPVMEGEGGMAIFHWKNHQSISTFVIVSLPPMRITHFTVQQEKQYNRRGIIFSHHHATQHVSAGANIFKRLKTFETVN